MMATAQFWGAQVPGLLLLETTLADASRLWSIRCSRAPWLEDEYSSVLEGTIRVLLGDSVVTGNPGDVIFKPREQWHTFWNAGDTPARVLEIISPAGLESYFRELGAELINGPPDPQRLAAPCARYALDMDMSSVPGLIQRFGVRFPAGPPRVPH